MIADLAALRNYFQTLDGEEFYCEVEEYIWDLVGHRTTQEEDNEPNAFLAELKERLVE